MALSVSLERLVHAISNSIIRAQNLVEKAQLSNFLTYIDKDNRPINFDLKLPAMQSAAKNNAEDTYRIPLATLVPHGFLVIKEAKIELDVEIGSVEQDSSDDDNYPDLQDIVKGKEPVRPKLVIDPEGGGVAKKMGGNSAHITLTLGYSENTEGLSRVLTEIIKGQGRVSISTTNEISEKTTENPVS